LSKTAAWQLSLPADKIPDLALLIRRELLSGGMETFKHQQILAKR
jgi:hypothetical protein